MSAREAPQEGTENRPSDAELRAGARNMLVGCIGIEAGQDVLVVREDSRHGYYDDAAGDCVAEEARGLGARVHSIWTPTIEGPGDFPAPLAAAMEHVDHTIFFSRIGDQLRFCDLPGKGTKTMTYALDAGFLGSPFCTVPHGLMEEVLAQFHGELDRVREWRITCPLGTDVAGHCEPRPAPDRGDRGDGGFTLVLFPVGIFRPVPCDSMSGRVVVARSLMGTSIHAYEPHVLPLEQPVTVIVEQGRIVDFEGDPGLVSKVRDHYETVASRMGIDRDVVHSWHAGINPKTFYPRPAEENIERWGGIAFASPRTTHFHTCGDSAPGEIAWSVIDATITLDGETFWKEGRFVFLEWPDIRALLDDYPGAEDAFEMRRDIGL